MTGGGRPDSGPQREGVCPLPEAQCQDVSGVTAGFERDGWVGAGSGPSHCSHQNGGGSWIASSCAMGPRAGGTVV